VLGRIRIRLTAAYVTILAVILLAFGALVVWGFWQQELRRQDALLEQKAEGLERRLEGGGIDEEVAEGYGWALLEPDGSLNGGVVADSNALAAGFGLPSLELARRALGRDGPAFGTVEGPEGEARAIGVPVEHDGTEYVLQAARPLSEAKGTVGRLVSVLVPFGLGALALAAVGGLFLSRRAMRPVEEAFERQREFVADASHEIKTPLALARVNTEAVLRDPAAPYAKELLRDGLGELDRMGDLVSDLLLLARLDAGRLAVGKEPFDLSAAVREAVERFDTRAQIEGKRIEVAAPEGLRARGDAERAGQVLAALLDNALRYAPPGGAVNVSCKREKDRVLATVADSGPGIPPEHLGRVFDRFYRAEEARAREGGSGTGLGLAIARDLARHMGGDLSAANAKGGGAAFTLELPPA